MDFIISPKSLEEALIYESKRLMKQVYGREVKKLYYRVKTKDKLDNPRRIFLKGNGNVIELELDPHISVVHSIEPEGKEDFIERARKICGNYQSLELEFEKVGNYGMDFTFFVGFKNNPTLGSLRSELLELSKPFLPDEKYEKYLQVPYIPHATVLYDDIEPKKVKEAFMLLDVEKFKKTVQVEEILVWEVTGQDQKVVAKLPLVK